jgi:hypothetical protein
MTDKFLGSSPVEVGEVALILGKNGGFIVVSVA